MNSVTQLNDLVVS